MKKLLLFFFTGYCVFFISSLGFANSQNIIFSDDFENYSVGTFPSSVWELVYSGYGTGYQIVTDETSISGSKSLKLEGKSNWSSNAIYTLPSTSDVIYLEGYVKTKKLSASVMNYNEAHMGFYNKNEGSWGIAYSQVLFKYDGMIYLNGESLQPWNPEQWYKIKIKYDSVNRQSDIWIDDVLKASNVSTSGKSGTYNSVLLMGGNDTHTRAWFDDIKVYTLSSTDPCSGECSQSELETKYQEGYQTGYDAGYQAGFVASCGNNCPDTPTGAITLNTDLSFYIPTMSYQTLVGGFDLEANFTFFGDQEGKLLWELKSYNTK